MGFRRKTLSILAAAVGVLVPPHVTRALPLHTPAFVSPALAGNETASIVGVYANDGIDLKGVPYGGTVEVRLVAGSVYRFTFYNPKGDRFGGIALRQRDEVFCSYGRDDCRVTRYRIDHGALEGVWADAKETSLGTERISHVRVGGGADELTGAFALESGQKPDGSSYGGTGWIHAASAADADIYQLSWTLDVKPPEQRYRRGVGFRDRDRLVVASSGYAGCAPVVYRITDRGRFLLVTFADAFVPSLGLGRGLLTKKSFSLPPE